MGFKMVVVVVVVGMRRVVKVVERKGLLLFNQ